MKRALTLFGMAVALWAAASCSKSEINIQEPEAPSAESVKVNISVSGLSTDTKAIKTGWASGDIINVYLDDAESIHTPDFTLTYDGSSWNASALDTAVVARLKTSGGTIYGFWEDSNSCINNDDWKKSEYEDWHITFPEIRAASAIEGHLVADFSVPYTFSVRDRTLSATIDNWKFQTDIQVVVSGLEYTPNRYVLFTDDYYTESKYEKIMNLYDIAALKAAPSGSHIDAIITINGDDVGGYIMGIKNEDGVAFVGQTYYPSQNRLFKFKLWDRHTGIVYTFEKSEYVYCYPYENRPTAVKIPFSKFYVDLGLSVKWGVCNLGAKDVIDSGNYYAWAETEYGKTNYNWESYKYIYYGGPYSWQYVSKYTVEDTQYAGMWYDWSNNAWVFTGDGIGTLEDGDDAARQSNGEGWRTPTADEWKELMDKCTWTWNEDYAGNNVIEVTSKVGGYMGNKIILPVAGRWVDNTLTERYIYGAYWSSSIDSTDSSNAKCAYFSATQPTALYQLERCQGLSVRPVKVN